MVSGIGFEFPIDGSDQWDGFNEPGMEHFTGSPLEHLGREVPQNTIDARIGYPARIRVKLISIPPKSIPGFADLKKAVDRCLAGSENESEKATAFFLEATKILDAKAVKVLQFSDSNTTGIRGPCVNGMPFFAMMKATGQSKKVGTATGSFGIGKFAPFTVSDLRTVFVTTVWKDEKGVAHHYVQGKSILMSYVDQKGATRRGTGFWGQRRNCMPVESVDQVPDWLRRVGKQGSIKTQVGTTVSIVGFSERKNWQRALAANIAENFFGALHEGQLQVEIEGGPSVNADTLSTIFMDADVKEAISEQKGEPENFMNVRHYLRAITDSIEVKVEETENLHLGKCRLRIVVGEGLPKKVAVLRNGMLITDELAGLKRFGPFKEFVAVLDCLSEKGATLLRAMEPPRHDDFEPSRLPPDKRHGGRVALWEITAWVRDMLDRHAKDPVSQVTTLDEMAEYFGDEEEAGPGKRTDENPGGAIIIRQRPVKLKSRPSGVEQSREDLDDEDNNDDGDGDQGGDAGAKNPSPGEGGSSAQSDLGNDKSTGTKNQAGKSGSRGTRAAPSGVELRDVRAVMLEKSWRKVAFTPSITGIISVELQDSGADTNHLLKVKNTTVGSMADGRIDGIHVVAGKRCIIDVELTSDFEGTIRVVANAV